ncbi:MAG: hypothetical protein ACLSDQ_13980, partial [Adlercreutzia equolifaciens]
IMNSDAFAVAMIVFGWVILGAIVLGVLGALIACDLLGPALAILFLAGLVALGRFLGWSEKRRAFEVSFIGFVIPFFSRRISLCSTRTIRLWSIVPYPEIGLRGCSPLSISAARYSPKRPWGAFLRLKSVAQVHRKRVHKVSTPTDRWQCWEDARGTATSHRALLHLLRNMTRQI